MTKKHIFLLYLLWVLGLFVGTKMMESLFTNIDASFVFLCLWSMELGRLETYRKLRPSMKTFYKQVFHLVGMSVVFTLGVGFIFLLKFIFSLI